MMRWPEAFSAASKGDSRGPDGGKNGSGMEKLESFWQWISGKKTAIGGSLLIAGNILRKFPQTQVAAEVVSEIGMYLTGFGLVHKGVKAASLK